MPGRELLHDTAAIMTIVGSSIGVIVWIFYSKRTERIRNFLKRKIQKEPPPSPFGGKNVNIVFQTTAFGAGLGVSRSRGKNKISRFFASPWGQRILDFLFPALGVIIVAKWVGL